MPSQIRATMLTRLETIAACPFARHSKGKSLAGEKDSFRLRQGDWRAVYRIVRERDEMRVVLVGVRGSVYR